MVHIVNPAGGSGAISDTNATSTANGAPNFDNPNSTVELNDSILHVGMVGSDMVFTGGGTYEIATVTDADTCTVVGDASGEPDARAITIDHLTTTVHCHGITDSGTNSSKLTFDTEAPPGSLGLMGVGY